MADVVDGRFSGHHKAPASFSIFFCKYKAPRIITWFSRSEIYSLQIMIQLLKWSTADSAVTRKTPASFSIFFKSKLQYGGRWNAVIALD